MKKKDINVPCLFLLLSWLRHCASKNCVRSKTSLYLFSYASRRIHCLYMYKQLLIHVRAIACTCISNELNMSNREEVHAYCGGFANQNRWYMGICWRLENFAPPNFGRHKDITCYFRTSSNFNKNEWRSQEKGRASMVIRARSYWRKRTLLLKEGYASCRDAASRNP